MDLGKEVQQRGGGDLLRADKPLGRLAKEKLFTKSWCSYIYLCTGVRDLWILAQAGVSMDKIGNSRKGARQYARFGLGNQNQP